MSNRLYASLELRFPPPLIAIIIACVMVAAHVQFNQPSTPEEFGVAATLAGCLFAIGIIIIVLAIIQFKRARTTVLPFKPEKTTQLVNTGIFSISRNPMYLGMTFCLFAIVIALANIYLALGPILLVIYLTEFQIKPEERILAKLFAEEFQNYKHDVRRWL